MISAIMYSAASLSRSSMYGVGLCYVVAANAHEALGMAYERGSIEHPEPEWSQHTARALAVPDDMVLARADEIRRKP